MSRASSLRAGRLAAALLLLFGLLPPAEARRKRSRRPKAERPDRKERPPSEPACREAGCDPGLKLLVEEEGTPPRPLSTFRYRVRIGEQRLDGACPPEKDAGPPPGRCQAGAVFVPISPEQLDVSIEAAGFRPALQTLNPAYEGPCCRRAELRLVLRRENKE